MQLSVAPADFQKYVAVSKQTRVIFADFDRDMEAGSLDEAFLDITSYCAAHNTSGVRFHVRFYMHRWDLSAAEEGAAIALTTASDDFAT